MLDGDESMEKEENEQEDVKQKAAWKKVKDKAMGSFHGKIFKKIHTFFKAYAFKQYDELLLERLAKGTSRAGISHEMPSTQGFVYSNSSDSEEEHKSHSSDDC